MKNALGIDCGVILAAGKGSRMPGTCKPLTMVGGKPLIAYSIEAMIACGIKRILIVYAKNSEALLAALPGYDADIEFVLDAEQKGSLGSFYHVKDLVTYPFIMMDADAIASAEDVYSMVQTGMNRKHMDPSINASVAIVETPVFSDPKAFAVRDGLICAYEKSGICNPTTTVHQGGMIYIWHTSPFGAAERVLAMGNYQFSMFYPEFVKASKVSAMPIRRLWDVDSPDDARISELLLLAQSLRAVAFDLDNTIIRSDKTVSAHTIQVLNRLKSKGVRLIAVTARILSSAQPWLRILGADDAVFSNGAGLFIHGEVASRMLIPYRDAQSILEKIHVLLPQKHVLIQSAVGVYANHEDPCAVYFEEPKELPHEDVERILIKHMSTYEYTSLMDAAQKGSLSIAHLEQNNLAITAPNATKGAALRDLLSQNGIKNQEIAGFGDDENDCTFLSECGIKIAVSNAMQSLKDEADFICDSCDADGVAKWLELFCL